MTDEGTTCKEAVKPTKAITFLGATDAYETAYEMPEETKPQYVAPFFGAALAQWKPGLDMYAFVTDDAYNKHWAQFSGLLVGKVADLKCVRIPDGRNQDELWTIFEEVVKVVELQDKVIFDMTHGFRSLPFLSFLAAAYLRTVKQIHLDSVLYGNFEARDKTVKPNRAPVIDITPFVSLLDWTVAADRFIQTGDARRLADLLNPLAAKEGPTAQASTTLSEVSLAAFLCQPFHLMPKACELREQLQAAQTQLHAQAKPFRSVQDRIVSGFDPFGVESDADDKTKLRAQFRLVQWYHTNNQLIQAVTLAREWLISAITIRLGQSVDVNLEPRKQMELAVSGLSLVGRRKVRDEQGGKRLFDRNDLNPYGQKIYDSWPEYEQIRRLWDKLSLVRNSLDHAGYQPDKLSVDETVGLVNKEIMPGLVRLATAWGYIEEQL